MNDAIAKQISISPRSVWYPTRIFSAMNPMLEFLQANIGHEMAGRTISPVAHWLNGTLTAAEEGNVTVTYVVRKEMTNPLGNLHGGMVAAIFDDIIGAAIFSTGLAGNFATINLNTDYLLGASLGETVSCRAWVVRKGRHIINAKAELHNTAGKLLAHCSSNLFIIPQGEPKPVAGQ